MQQYPKITVLTVNYNKAKYLESTIKSVVDQNYPNLEYIIIDGKSTDKSVEIIKKYESYLSYWISEPDNGMTDALIKGFNRASGEILAWLNSDDLYEKDTLMSVAELYNKTGFDFLYGSMSLINETGVKFKFLPCRKTCFKAQAYGAVTLFQPSCFWSRSIYEKIGGLDLFFRVSMDGDLFTRILKEKTTKKLTTKKYLSQFRIHPEQSASWAPEGKYVYERNLIGERYLSVNKLEKLYYRYIYRTYSHILSRL